MFDIYVYITIELVQLFVIRYAWYALCVSDNFMSFVYCQSPVCVWRSPCTHFQKCEHRVRIILCVPGLPTQTATVALTNYMYSHTRMQYGLKSDMHDVAYMYTQSDWEIYGTLYFSDQIVQNKFLNALAIKPK